MLLLSRGGRLRVVEYRGRGTPHSLLCMYLDEMFVCSSYTVIWAYVIRRNMERGSGDE